MYSTVLSPINNPSTNYQRSVNTALPANFSSSNCFTLRLLYLYYNILQYFKMKTWICVSLLLQKFFFENRYIVVFTQIYFPHFFSTFVGFSGKKDKTAVFDCLVSTHSIIHTILLLYEEKTHSEAIWQVIHVNALYVGRTFSKSLLLCYNVQHTIKQI